MERIFVTYRPVEGTVNIAYHMTLNYIDKFGQHRVIDGGPEIVPQKKLEGALKEHFISKPEQNIDSDFGRLVLNDPSSENLRRQMRDIYAEGKILKPYTHIAEGKDLSSVWNRFNSTARDITGRYEYRPTKQNSNSFVADVLKKNGFNKKLGFKDRGLSNDIFTDDVNMPNTDADRTIRLNIPGSETELNNPIEDLKPEALKRIKLIATKPETPAANIPEKGPKRVDNDPFYNPLDFKNNGFEDLMGEVHLLKKNRKRFIELAETAGRSNDFPLLFEDA